MSCGSTLTYRRTRECERGRTREQRERETQGNEREDRKREGGAVDGCRLDRGDSEGALFTDEEQQAADMEAKGIGMPQGNTHFTRNTLHQTHTHTRTHT